MEKMKTNKILVTGCNGAVGKSIADRLWKMGKPVRMIGGKREIDLTIKQNVEKIFSDRYDLVIHCAISGRFDHLSIDQEIVRSNLLMFSNMVQHQDMYSTFINIGSGAEFDHSKNIEMAIETDIWQRTPVSSYGFSKNVISRLASSNKKFYTLRLFGFLGDNMPENTIVRSFENAASNGTPFTVENDRLFDWFTSEDLFRTIMHVNDTKPRINDINLVYHEKLSLSELLSRYAGARGYDQALIKVASKSKNNYTGDGSRLSNLGLDLSGLEKFLSAR